MRINFSHCPSCSGLLPGPRRSGCSAQPRLEEEEEEEDEDEEQEEEEEEKEKSQVIMYVHPSYVCVFSQLA